MEERLPRLEEEPHRVITEISPRDGMHKDPRRYFQGAHSDLRQIKLALLAARKLKVDSILDLPCGHGRVLRMLKAEFQQARLTACDIDRDAVDFCSRVFGATPVYSRENPAEIELPERFDLIWSGSLLTHLNEDSWNGFLDLFESALAPDGVLLFSTNGRHPAHMLKSGQTRYGLSEDVVPGLLDSYEKRGFGHHDYPGQSNYGISLSTPAWVCSQLEQRPGLKLLMYNELGRQDHVACQATRRSTRA